MDDVVLLTLIIALVFGAIGVSSPLMTLYLQSLGANYAQIALIMASTAGLGLACSYAWGRISDTLGRRKPLIAAGVCVAPAPTSRSARSRRRRWPGWRGSARRRAWPRTARPAWR